MPKHLFRILCACFLSLSLLLTSCGNLLDDASSSDSDTSRGALSITDITMDSYPVSFMEEIQKNIEASAGELFTAASYSVNQYNLVYHTIDAKGNATLASAKLLIPDANTDLDLVVYLHGTTSLDADAPTNAYADFSDFNGDDATTIDHNIADMKETAMLMSFVSDTNIAVLMPDYLGFGASEGLHPYMHGASLASATIDAIRAALNFASLSSNPFSLTGDFTLTGYSEGGYAVMATHKELLADNGTVESAYLDIMGSEGARLKAVIPGAPPCNISQRMAAVMLPPAGIAYPAPAFAAYVALAYNEIYDIEANISTIFSPTYNYIIDDFDGSKSLTTMTGEFLAGGIFPPTPISMFSTEFQDAILADYTKILEDPTATPDDDFYQKFKENDVFDYHPGTAYYEIIYTASDEIVPSINATEAAEALAVPGRSVNILFDPAEISSDPTGINLFADPQDSTYVTIKAGDPSLLIHSSAAGFYIGRSFNVSKMMLSQ
ncbi:hypothetical protein DID74_01080 [Candidatus Marinamargulisbacteria bacterium SCGC AG-333-B06]|nr:hypothetical protein DID74_01080 [Candidatus Marinamargulisbacteria bacterium SCGC AG-333-B06]